MRARVETLEVENRHVFKLLALQSRWNEELLSFTKLNEGVSSRPVPEIRKAIDQFYNLARECVDYVATANYRERDQEAKKSLREGYDRLLTKL